MRALVCVAWTILQSLSFLPSTSLALRGPTSERHPTSVSSEAALPQERQATGDFTVKANAVMVTVDAVVRNRKGSFIGDLLAEDFAVYDNGVAQQITLFSREQLPLAVALVVDRSPSIRPWVMQLRSAALTALQRLKSEDQVALFSFDMNPAQFSELTEDLARIARLISRIPGGVGTNILDALFDAARELYAKAPDRRRAIILISDNCQTVPSVHSYGATMQEVLESAVTLYSIRTRGDNPGSSYLEDPRSISKMAEESGGETLDAESVGKLGTALDAAILNLKQGYVLGFAPSSTGPDGSYHRLTVKLNSEGRCPGCRVQARTGYYAGVHEATPLPGLPRASGKTGARETDRIAGFEEYVAQTRIVAARNEKSDLMEIPFEVRTSEVSDGKGMPQIKVDLQVDASNVLFKVDEDRHVGRLRITTFYLDAKGKPLGADWKIMDMRLMEATYQQIMRSGIPYSTTIPLKTPKQRIKVVVYDPWSDRIGTKLIELG